MRSGKILVAVSAVVIALGVALFVVRDEQWLDDLVFSEDTTEVFPSDPTEIFNTAIVTRTSVADTAELDATLSYINRVELVHRVDSETIVVTSTQPASGPRGGVQTVITTQEVPGSRAVTALPEVGVTLAPGDVLYETDGSPVFLAQGAVAAYRTMDADTAGDDVAQLEQFLVAGGHDPDGVLEVDGDWTDDTTVAVQVWQTAVGLDVSGEVALGDIWFVSGPVRVVEVEVTVGTEVADGDPVLTYTSTQRRIELSVDELPDGLIEADTLDVRLRDRSIVPGQVTSVRGTADGFDLVLDVDLSGAVLSSLDQQPVTIIWSVAELADALVIPPEAIHRQDTGEFVVQVLDDEVIRQTSVEIVGQAGRVVAVTGIADQDVVVLP